MAIRTTHWTAINHSLIWGTLALWLPFLALLQGLCGSVPSLNPLCGLGPELLGSADYTIMVFQRQVAPRASQLLQVGGWASVLFRHGSCCCAGSLLWLLLEGVFAAAPRASQLLQVGGWTFVAVFMLFPNT